MTSEFTPKEQDDFVARLLALVDNQRSTEAADAILAVDGFADQLRILIQLASHLNKTGLRLHFQLSLLLPIHQLAYTRDYSLLNDLALEVVDILSIAHDMALEFALDYHHIPQMNHDRALARARALDLAMDLARDRAHNESLARTLSRARGRALDRALALTLEPDLDHDLDTIQIVIEGIIFLIAIDYIPANIQEHINQAYYQIVANLYEECLNQKMENPSPLLGVIFHVIQTLLIGDLGYITLDGVDQITPDILAYDIIPYLQALGEIQQVYCQINGEIFIEPRIVQIHSDCPKIEIIGLSDTILTVSNVVSARKRKHDAGLWHFQTENANLHHRILELENQRIAAEIQAQILQAETRQNTQLSDAEKKSRITEVYTHLRQIQASTHQQEISLEEQCWELEQAQIPVYFALTQELLAALAPAGLPTDNMTEYLPKVAHVIKVMWGNRLNMRIGYHDIPVHR